MIVSQHLIVAALFLATGSADAQATFPSKPIRMVVPNTPGSQPDMIARLIGASSGEI